MGVKSARATILLFAGILLTVSPVMLRGQKSVVGGPRGPSGLALRADTRQVPPDTLRDPDAAAWQAVPAQRVALNRTPPLYDTDPPAELEIPFVDARLVRAGGRLFFQLSWHDATEDSARLAAAPTTPPEARDRKEQTEATERFFDAAAVMLPARAPESGVWPSLQMGDASGPVVIYYWNAARGALIARAEGRGTTRRTNESFPARAAYREAAWRIVLELPDLPAGMPVAFAVWNGSQLDRDGRKYFSVWLRVE
jgi:complex iron-sulfur molybdoenzyme family reductase subunit gamma